MKSKNKYIGGWLDKGILGIRQWTIKLCIPKIWKRKDYCLWEVCKKFLFIKLRETVKFTVPSLPYFKEKRNLLLVENKHH